MTGVGFDNNKYIEEQTKYILERIESSEGRLYIECGGKLLYDKHASRVLPGFGENGKMEVFRAIRDKLDVIICIYAGDIEKKKIRSDFGISYDADVLKMIDDFASFGINCDKVVITRYSSQSAAERFKNMLEMRNIKVYTHPKTPGYPADLDVVVSENGYGKNRYIEVNAPVVIVTAPGPGSGKLATCLSQMYHESKSGKPVYYSKFETFPIWNLPLDHPVNIAYEAATADIGDTNLIDHFHLNAYGEVAVNYSRDIEAFPILSKILLKITNGRGKIYQSPTDMGVNRAGFAITDDALCRQAGKQEIIRRYFQINTDYILGLTDEETFSRISAIMSKIGLSETDRSVVLPARNAMEKALREGKGKDGTVVGAAIEISEGRIITAHNSEMMHASSALILNALKAIAGIDSETDLISSSIIESITTMKRDVLSGKGVSMNLDEILIALAMSASENGDAKKALIELPKLRNTEVHMTHIPSPGDASGLRKLGISFTSDGLLPGRNAII